MAQFYEDLEGFNITRKTLESVRKKCKEINLLISQSEIMDIPETPNELFNHLGDIGIITDFFSKIRIPG